MLACGLPVLSRAVSSSPQARIRCVMAHATSSLGGSTLVSAYAKQPRLLEELGSTFKLGEGFAVDLQLCSATSINPAPGASPFHPQPFFAALTSQDMGQLLLTTSSIDSTQSFLRAHSQCLPAGTVLVADQQTQGKGRGGNTWTSPAGCLMFSAARRLRVSGTAAPFINYVVCLAVLQGIRAAARDLLQGQEPNVQVKWPNDIYSGGVKIGGALIHTSWQGEGFNVVTGIGLNVSNQHPTTCLNSVLSQQLQLQQQQGVAATTHPRSESSAADAQTQAAPAAAAAAASSVGSDPTGVHAVQVCREELLAHICSALERCFNVFEQQGFQALEQEYLRCWMHSGQNVTLVDPPGAEGQPGQAVALTITGLSSTGFLQAVDAAGSAYELTPDGNSLDMMQGLLRRKM